MSQRSISFWSLCGYAGPALGYGFFYISMWSVIPGIYVTSFGLSLGDLASALPIIRAFDGVTGIVVGYISDRLHSIGVSRRYWVVVGSVGVAASCQCLFVPGDATEPRHFLLWSLLFYLSFNMAYIPHVAWANDVSIDYQKRAAMFTMYAALLKLGNTVFYALPLISLSGSFEYSPRTLRYGEYVGVFCTAAGLMLMAAAPASSHESRHDTRRLLDATGISTVIRNRPLTLFLAAVGALGIGLGMWFSLQFLYLTVYVKAGESLGLVFFIASALSIVSAPICFWVIKRSSKATAWIVGVGLFSAQLVMTLFLRPDTNWYLVLCTMSIANIALSFTDIAPTAILGDIVDYARLKFRKRLSGTYLAIETLLFKASLGIGGSVAVGIAESFGFSGSGSSIHGKSLLGLKLGFIVLPMCALAVSVGFIACTPITRNRHRIIQMRLDQNSERILLGRQSRMSND